MEKNVKALIAAVVFFVPALAAADPEPSVMRIVRERAI
jgi:hypothetical protein